jgi:hypothetical protein
MPTNAEHPLLGMSVVRHIDQGMPASGTADEDSATRDIRR